jgi:tRNA 2-selenouridine synthase
MDQFEVAEEFLIAGKSIPIVDVRSPAEFLQGHIPGAVNIPLFSNDERALIGTTYVQVGHQQAVDLGADIALPRAAALVAEARKFAAGRKLLVHCWRGGMRSGAVASLFNLAGLEAATLKGGYKAYRRLVHDSFEKRAKLVIIGGFTGTGKSEILRILESKGEQVLDLEGLAHHKGSVFGGIGQTQPTNEQFENNIYTVWAGFDLSRRIYVEDESLRIGSNVIPEAIFAQIKDSPMILAGIPRELRLERIIAEYGSLDRLELIAACGKIQKRMGLEKYKEAVAALENSDIPLAASLLLDYYDRTYSNSMAKRVSMQIKVSASSVDECADLCRSALPE